MLPLDPDKIRESLRSLYATGLYQTIEVAGVRAGDNVSIIFSGVPRLFLGRVNVEGVKDDRLDAVLDSATQLQAGTAYSDSKAALAEPALQTALENNGYYRGQIAQTKVIDRENSLVDINFYTTTGNPGPDRRRGVDRRQRADRSPVSQAGKTQAQLQGQPQHRQPRPA